MRPFLVACLLAAAAAADDDPVPALLKQVADPDRAMRAKAARALGRTNDERALAALRTALEDKEETVRIAAAASLGKLGAADARVVEVLARGLRSPAWYDRWEACLALGAIGPPAEAAVPALVEAVHDPELDISREAVRALGAVGPKDERALAGLVRLLDSAHPKDRVYILGLLEAAKRCDLAAEWLAGEMRSNRFRLRLRALDLLKCAGSSGVSALVRSATDENPWVRAVSIGALGELEAKEASDLVLAAASDGDFRVRRTALCAIRSLKPEGGARVATGALSDPDEEVRIAAAITLKELKVKVPAAGPGLVRVFNVCPDSSYMSTVFTATGFPGLAEFLRAEERRGDPPWVLRLRPSAGPREGIELRDDRGATNALDALVSEVEDKEHGEALVAALRETLAPKQDEILILDLAGKNPALRRAAAILLGHLAQEPEPCLVALETALKDEDQSVAAAAKAAIERLRARK